MRGLSPKKKGKRVSKKEEAEKKKSYRRKGVKDTEMLRKLRFHLSEVFAHKIRPASKKNILKNKEEADQLQLRSEKKPTYFWRENQGKDREKKK